MQMPSKSKKYLITTIKQEVIQARKAIFTRIEFCKKCKKDVEMQTLDAVTSKTGKHTRKLFELIESRMLHFVESSSGHLLICQKSLTELIEKERKTDE